MGSTNCAFSESLFDSALLGAQAGAAARDLRGDEGVVIDSGEQRDDFRALAGSVTTIQLAALEYVIESCRDRRE